MILARCYSLEDAGSREKRSGTLIHTEYWLVCGDAERSLFMREF
jgi:hypothetical protein